MSNRKYKTMMCRHFLKNQSCQLGNRCCFAHNQSELRKENDPVPSESALAVPRFAPESVIAAMRYPNNYKTSICQYNESGYCKNANNCMFAHGSDEIKQYPNYQGRNPNQGMVKQMQEDLIMRQARMSLVA